MKYALACLMATACVRSATRAKFADRPIVTRSDDQRAIAEPETNSYYSRFYLADVMVFDPVIETFDRPRRSPSADTNALDEVPDSTWFTNRIGVREITPDEAARGADLESNGPPQLPLEVTSAKPGGANPGFIAKDARGIKYIIKFDTSENPEMQTATNSIAGRILWAAGYNTPAESVFYYKRNQVTLAAKLRGKISEADLDRMMRTATRRGDEFRASASAFLAGTPKGGFEPTGTRHDDPNDRVAHERRRVLRGLRTLAAWLNHTDMKEDNSLDMYVGDPGKGHIIHYLVDFGEAFSGHQSETQNPRIGYEHGWDYKAQIGALFTFGLVKRDWEYQEKTPWKSIGWYGAIAFDPTAWRERYPYAPFHLAERADLYWGAKLVMKFTRDQLARIVETGQLSDPAAAAYLLDTLVKRRAIIGATYLDVVTPLEDVQVTPGTLCAVDLARQLAVARDGTLELAKSRHPIAGDGRVCAALDTGPGYHVVEARIHRAEHTTPAMEIHYVGGETPHVVGIVR